MQLNPLVTFNKNTRKGDPKSLIGSNLKASQLLGFQSNFDIKSGISEYIEWFKLNDI